LKGHYRFHFQLSAPAIEDVQTLWRSSGETLKPAGKVEMAVDVDPVNMR